MEKESENESRESESREACNAPCAKVLRRLSLGSKPIGDAGCIAIADALLSPRFFSSGCGLAVLQLGDTDIGDAGAAALAYALEEGAMPQGLQLWLACTRVSAEGRGMLMMAATQRPSLRVCW